MKKFLLAAPLAIVSVSAYGQAVSVNGGAIQGTITDPSGAAVPNATINIVSADQGSTKTITTDKSGFYSVGPLNPGTYTIKISAAGFQNTEVKTRILTGTATPGSFKLTVGQSSETIEVTAGDIQVNTDQAGVSDVITREQIASLPVNGRNFLDLAQIEPGVQLTNGNTFDPTKSGYTGISVNGTSGRTTRILLDGQDITDEFVGTTIFNVSQGAINEFQLSRSTQDAAGEVTSQGSVQVSTRSGTNSIHGEAFYIFQDQRALDANPNSTANAAGAHVAPYFQRNQYGGSVGFPIIKDKLFAFGNAERIVQNSASPSNLGTVFNTAGNNPVGQTQTLASLYPTVGTPYRQTYSTARLDYQGPFGGHYFARGNYNVDSTLTAGGTTRFAAYPNRDNTFGGAFGADFSKGRMTHSFRGSYEKFHNLIVDGSATSGYDPLVTANGPVAVSYSGQIYFGPNANAPQATYQSDKQLRYDGGYTVGKHNIRFGGALNRIQSGAYAAFYGIGPRLNPTASNLLAGTVTATNPLGLGCSGVPGAAACPGDPINGYNTSSATIGNGQGYSNSSPAFGLPGGGVGSWRFSFYAADAWKVTPSLTLTAGLRYSADTNRQNNSVKLPTCADLSSTVSYVCGSASGSTNAFSLFNSAYTGSYVNQPYGNLGPQAGIVYAPGNHKTVLRAGFGLFYESVVFNNSSNAEGALLKVSPSYYSRNPCTSLTGINFPDGSVVSTTPDGTSFTTNCLGRTIAQSAPQFAALEKSLQANARANSATVNGSYFGNTLSASGLYAPVYRQPLSEQWNFGLQRELFKGGVLSADYIHNMTWRIGQTIDLNHQGAARNFNAAYALAAINRLSATDGCGTATTATSQAVVQCEIGKGRSIASFASVGLDSSSVYDANNNWKYAKGDPAAATATAAAKANTPAAFPGSNPDLGSGSFIRPTGRSGYDALQVVYRQSTSHPVPGIEHGNFQISYNLSRIVSNLTSSDQFFTSGAYDADNPNQYIGRNGLDRKHQLSFGGSINPKYGPEIGVIGHFFSALPSTLYLDSNLASGNIFTTDITGDGTTGDVAPGTLPGDYMHRIKSDTLGQYITTFNGSYAGKPTPAGQAVINSNLMSLSQLTALKGVIQPVAQLPTTRAVNNPMFRSLDVNFSYPIRFNKVHEGFSLTPKIAFYNVANFSNFASTVTNPGTLQNTTTAGGAFNSGTGGAGFITGPNNFATYSASRTYRGVGTFSQGAPRQTEFQLTATF
ncbi:TonB-dependent receptor [Terriglobus roseus]|uniref:TonB-dependent Receptor Plug Domain n=1 Tax=Terriglobus roseus TaxID=392734 RepID=A0A1H4MNV5_9BACT|nr:TonB-dependent receptor [Terriglobus roseus]SEB84751.1 TonB-dependent Receptor Plug Domain [Terriglobus roseus]